MVQHCYMQSDDGNRIYIVRRVQFPSDGFKFGKVWVVVIHAFICSKPLFYLYVSLPFRVGKLNHPSYNDTVARSCIQSHDGKLFFFCLKVPGHLFANESPCISEFKKIMWDLSCYLGVSSASTHTDWSLLGMYDVLSIVKPRFMYTQARLKWKKIIWTLALNALSFNTRYKKWKRKHVASGFGCLSSPNFIVFYAYD